MPNKTATVSPGENRVPDRSGAMGVLLVVVWISPVRGSVPLG